jgi:hypothetical protein
MLQTPFVHGWKEVVTTSIAAQSLQSCAQIGTLQ